MSDPSNGTAWVTSSDTIYFAPWGFVGTTELTYEVCGEDGACASAVLTVTVESSGGGDGDGDGDEV